MRKKTTFGVIIITVLLIISLPLFQVLYAIIYPLFTGKMESFGLLTDARLFNLFLRSFSLAIMVVIFTSLIAIPLALLFVHYRFLFSKGFLFLMIAPIFIPPYIQGIAWIYLMGNEGWLNHLLATFTGMDNFHLTIYGFWGSVFVLSLWLYPVMHVHYLIAYSQCNTYSEAAGLFQSRCMVFRKVIFPLGKHAVWSGVALVFVMAITNFSVPGILELNVYPVEIFSQIGAFFNFSDASILSLPYLLLAIAFTLFLIASTKKMFRYSLLHVKPAYKLLKSPGQAIIIFLLVLFLFIVLVFPVVVLIIETKGIVTFLSALQNSWKPLMHSVILSLAGAGLITALGLLLALHTRNSKNINAWIAFLLIFPIFIYGGLYGIGLIETWNQKFLQNLIYGNFLIILLGYLRFLPIGFFLIYSGMIKIPNAYSEVSLITGRNKMAFYQKVFIPLLKPVLTASLLVSFIFCFTELDTTILVYPAGIETLPVSIFSLLHYGANEQVAAICLIQMVTIALLLMVFVRNFKLTNFNTASE